MLKGRGFLRVFLALLLLSGIEPVGKDSFLKVLLGEDVSPEVQHMLKLCSTSTDVIGQYLSSLRLRQLSRKMVRQEGALTNTFFALAMKWLTLAKASIAFSHTQWFSLLRHFALFPNGDSILKAEDLAIGRQRQQQIELLASGNCFTKCVLISLASALPRHLRKTKCCAKLSSFRDC